MSLVEFDELNSQLLRVRAEIGVAVAMCQRMRAVSECVALMDHQEAVNDLIVALAEKRGKLRLQLVVL